MLNFKVFEKVRRMLFFVTLFLLQSYLIRFHVGGYPSNLLELLIGLDCLLFGVVLWKERRLPRWREHRILFVFVGLSLLSLVFSFSFGEILSRIDLIRHLKFLVFAGALSFVFFETFKSDDEKMKGLKVLGLGAVGFGLFSVFYNLLGWNVTHDFRLLGPLDAAVYLAYYMTPFFIYFVVNGLENKRRNDVVLSILLGVLIIATRSMLVFVEAWGFWSFAKNVCEDFDWICSCLCCWCCDLYKNFANN